MKFKNFGHRTRGALAGVTLSILLLLVAIALPSDGSFSGNIGGLAGNLLVAPVLPAGCLVGWLIDILIAPVLPVGWRIDLPGRSGAWMMLVAVFLGPIVFWTVFGGIIGIALEKQPSRKHQILIGTFLYLGMSFYYLVAYPPEPNGILF